MFQTNARNSLPRISIYTRFFLSLYVRDTLSARGYRFLEIFIRDGNVVQHLSHSNVCSNFVNRMNRCVSSVDSINFEEKTNSFQLFHNVIARVRNSLDLLDVWEYTLLS